MGLQKFKSIAFFTTAGFASIFMFQNCSKISASDIASPKIIDGAAATGVPVTEPEILNPTINSVPSIEVSASATTVVEGQDSILTVRLHLIETAKYKCTNRLTGEVLATGDITQQEQLFSITVNHDLECEVIGFAKNSEDPVIASTNLTLDCANRIKNANDNKCQDFKCEKVIELTSLNDLLKIEARDARGLCYAIKLLNGIENSSSSLTKDIDQDVTSRNHDSGATNHHPYNMGTVKTEFRLEGQRVVKLSGGLSETAPILVDNFVLIGVHPADQDVSSDLNSAYSALGTADSTVINEKTNSDTNAIEFNQTLIPLKKFGTGGTISLSAVDITRSAKPQVIHSLDFRALDCGGSRELSDIYLLFQ